MQSIIMLNVTNNLLMLSVAMLNVLGLSVVVSLIVKLSAIMLIVIAPSKDE